MAQGRGRIKDAVVVMAGNAGEGGDDGSFEAPEDGRNAEKRKAREQRLAAAMRANLRRRKVSDRDPQREQRRSVGRD